MADEIDDHTMKEPIPGTSRTMSDMDAQMIADDGFGGSGFGRKFFNSRRIFHCANDARLISVHRRRTGCRTVRGGFVCRCIATTGLADRAK